MAGERVAEQRGWAGGGGGIKKGRRQGMVKRRADEAGCNSQIYHFSPAASSYFMPKTNRPRTTRPEGERRRETNISAASPRFYTRGIY